MSKNELIEMLKIANCDINTIIFAVNAWEMGAEWQKEQTKQSPLVKNDTNRNF
jgi:hypothetical protein